MMRSLAMILALALLVPTTARAQQFFDFDGQVTPFTVVGDQVTMLSIVGDPSGVETPLPLDFANFQYTIVVSDLIVDLIAPPQTGYVLGTIALYEDAGTPADYADPSTFTDGTALLTGTLESVLVQYFTATLGSGSGVVNWTGGSQIGDFHPDDRTNWSFLISVSGATEPGYGERWDGKVEPLIPVVDGDDSSWGALKSEF